MARKVINGECIYCGRMVYPNQKEGHHFSQHGKGKNSTLNFFHEACWIKEYARDISQEVKDAE